MSTPHDRIVVIGAGCSALITELVTDGYGSITAIDISASALDRSSCSQTYQSLAGWRSGHRSQLRSDAHGYAWGDKKTLNHEWGKKKEAQGLQPLGFYM